MYKIRKTKPMSPGQEPVDYLQREDGLFIPMSEENRHYQEYLKWVAEGNTPEPADQDE